MSEQAPSIGRIVHYVSYGTPGGEFVQECRAAVVTAADGSYVDLCVMNPTGLFFNRACPYDGEVTELAGRPTGAQHAGGTWHWPERV